LDPDIEGFIGAMMLDLSVNCMSDFDAAQPQRLLSDEESVLICEELRP
jgi:hypothetical protein